MESTVTFAGLNLPIIAARVSTMTSADCDFYPTFGPAITSASIRKATGSRMTVKDSDRWTAIKDGQGALVGLTTLRTKNGRTATLMAVYGEDLTIKAEALQAALDDARAEGFKNVEVQVKVENIAWYAALGFVPFGPVAYGFQAVRVSF